MFGDPFPEYVSPALIALVAKHAPTELDLFDNWLRSMKSPLGARPDKSSNNSKHVVKGDVKRVASSSKNREHQSFLRNVNEKSQSQPMSDSSSCLSRYRSASSRKDNGSPRPRSAPALKTPTSSLGSARKSSDSLTRIVPLKRDSATISCKVKEGRKGLQSSIGSEVLDSNSSRDSVVSRRTLEKKSGKPSTFEAKESGKELSLTILRSSGTTDKCEGRSISPRVCDSPAGAWEKENPFSPSDKALTSRGSISSRKSHPGGVSWKLQLQHRTDKHSPPEGMLLSPKTDQALTSTKVRKLSQKHKTSNKYEIQQTNSYKDRIKQFDQKRRAKMCNRKSANPKVKEHQPPWDFDVAVRSFDGVGPWFGSPTAKQQEMDIPLPVTTFDKFVGVEWESPMKSGEYGPLLRCFQTSIVELCPTINVKQFSRSDVREKRSDVKHPGTMKPKSREPVIKRASWKRGVLIARKPQKSLAALGIVPRSRQQKAAERRMKNSCAFKIGNNRAQRDSSSRHTATDQIGKPYEVVTKMSEAVRRSGVASMKGKNAVPLNNQVKKGTSSRIKQNHVSQNISNATVRRKGVAITGRKSAETPKLPTGKGGQKRKQKEDVAVKKAPRFTSCRESSNLQENKKLRQSVRENSEDSEKSCLPLIRNLAQQLINRVDAACTYNLFNEAEELHSKETGTLSLSEIPDCTVILPDSPLWTSESLILKQSEHIASDSVSEEILYAAALHPGKEKLDLTELEQAGGTPSLEHRSVGKDAITCLDPRSSAGDKEGLENSIVLLPEPDVKEDNRTCLPRIDDNSETKNSRLIQATSDIFEIKLPNVERLKRDKKDDMHGRPRKLRKEEWSLPVKGDPLSVINIYTKHRLYKEKEQSTFYHRECEEGVQIFEIGGDLTPKKGQGCCIEEIPSPSGQEAVASVSSTILAGTKLAQTGIPDKSPRPEYANQNRAEQTYSPIDDKLPPQGNIRESTDTTMTSSSSHVVHWNRNLHRKDAISFWRRLSVEIKKLKRIRRAWRHAYPPVEFKIDGWEDVLFGNKKDNLPVNEFSNQIPENRRWQGSIEVEHKKSYKRRTPLASIEARNRVNGGECAANPTSTRNNEIPIRKQDVENDTDELIFPEMDTRENHQQTRIRKGRKCRILPSLSQEAQKIDWLAKKVITKRREAQQWRLKWKRHLLETELKRLDTEINETRTRIEKNLYVFQAQQSQVPASHISQDLPSQSGSGKLREPVEPTVKLMEAPYVQIAATNLIETINQRAKEEPESAVDTSNYSDSFVSEENEEKRDHPVVANKAELHENWFRERGNLKHGIRDSVVGVGQSNEKDSSHMEAASDEQSRRGDLKNLWERIKDQKNTRSCSSSIKDLILPEDLEFERSSPGEHDTAQTVSEEEFLTEIQPGKGAEPVEFLSDHVKGIDKDGGKLNLEHGLLDVVTDNETLSDNQESGVSVSLEESTEKNMKAQVKHENAGVNNGSNFEIEVKSEVSFSFEESDISARINTQGAIFASSTKGFTELSLKQPSPPFQSQDVCLHKDTSDKAQSADEEEGSEFADGHRGSQSEVNIAAEIGISNRINISSSLEFLQGANMFENPTFSAAASTSHVLGVTNIKESSGFSGEPKVMDEERNVDERSESHLLPQKSPNLDSTSDTDVCQKDIFWSRQSVAGLQDSSKEVLEEKSPTWSYSSEMSKFSDMDDDRLQTEDDHFEVQMGKEESMTYCESRLSATMENATGPARERERKKDFACPSPSTDDAGESENLQMEGRPDESQEVQQTQQRVLDDETQKMEQRFPEIEISQIEPEQRIPKNEVQEIEPEQRIPDYDKPCEKQFLPEIHANEKSGASSSNSIPQNVDNSNPTLNTVQMLDNSLDLDEDIPEEIVIDDHGSTCTEDDADLTSEGYEQDLSRIRAAFGSTVLEKNDEPGNCDDSGEDSASSKETFLSLSRAYYGSSDPPEQAEPGHTEHGQTLDVQKAVLAEARLEHEIEKLEKQQNFSDRMTDVLFTNILQNEVVAMNPAHAPTTLPSLKTKAGLFPLTKSVSKLSSKQHEDPNRQLLMRATSLELKGVQNIVPSSTRSLSPVSSSVVLRDAYSTISQQYVEEYVGKFLQFSACPVTSNVYSMLENSLQHHTSYQHHKRFNRVLYDCVRECMVKGDTKMGNSEVAPALADRIVSYLELSRIPACKLVIRLVEEGWQDCDMNVVTAELCEAVLHDLIEELIDEEGTE